MSDCKYRIELPNFGITICIPIYYERKKWPWEELFVERFKDLFEDPREPLDVLDRVRVEGLERGAWSRDLPRVAGIAAIVEGIESPALREQLAAALNDASQHMLKENGVEAEIQLGF